MKFRTNTRVQTRDCVVLRQTEYADGAFGYEVEAIGGENLYAGPGKAKALRVFAAHLRLLKSRARAALKASGGEAE